VGAGTGLRVGSELLYGSANATLALSGAQPENVPSTQWAALGVPVTALNGQYVPDGQVWKPASVVPWLGQYVPVGQPTQAEALALL